MGDICILLILLLLIHLQLQIMKPTQQLINAFGAGLVSFQSDVGKSLLTVFGVYLQTNQDNNFIIN